MTLERHEKKELISLLSGLKEYAEGLIETCLLPGATEPRETYQNVVSHERDRIGVINGWIARLSV